MPNGKTLVVWLNLLQINWQGQAARKICTPNGPLVVVNDCSVSVAVASPIQNTPPLPIAVRHSGTAITSGSNADGGFSPARPRQPPPIKPRRAIIVASAIRAAMPAPAPSVATIAPVVATSGAIETMIDGPSTAPPSPPQPPPPIHQTAIRLSPRLEMRLALNQDILGEEDLINFEHGTINLESILGRDLSSYQRCTGKDLMQARPTHTNRIAPTDVNLFAYASQKNSKMDTPTPNRRKPNQNTWNSSVCAAAGECFFEVSSFCVFGQFDF